MDAQAPAQSYPYSYLHLYLHLYPYPDSTLYLGHWYDHGGVLGHQLALVPGDSHLAEAVEAVEGVDYDQAPDAGRGQLGTDWCHSSGRESVGAGGRGHDH